MPKAAITIFPADDVWRIVSAAAIDDIRVDRESSPAQVAAAVAAALQKRGYRAEGVLLALPSPWCLAAVISTADFPRQDRAALAFRLEEKLPLPAEQFTADFIPLPDDKALGVCVESDRIVPLVDALESAGVVVQSISPAALLALDATLPPTTARPSLVLWGQGAGGAVNVFAVENRIPVAWALASTPEELRLHADLMTLEFGDCAILAHAVPPEFLDVLPGDADRLADNRDLLPAAATRAPAVLSGNAPWIDLRRGALAADDALRVIRRPANAALAAAAIFLLALTAVFLYRAHRYDRLARDTETRLAEDFKREFPGWPVPTNVRAVVESERRKLLATGSSALPPEAQESALRTLHAVLSKIPPDAANNLTFKTITFNDTSLQLDGQAKTNEAVDVVVNAARATGMDVPPPVLQKAQGNVWSFTVRASKPLAPSHSANVPTGAAN
jgi:hypothetical protein